MDALFSILASPYTVGIVVVLLYLFSMINIIREYERAVVFRLGRLLPTRRARNRFHFLAFGQDD